MDGNTPVIPTKPFDRSAKLEALAEWTKVNGIELNDCEIKTGGLDGAGLYATKDVSATDIETPLVSVPLKSVLTRRAIFRLAQNNDFFKDLLFRKADGTKIDVGEISDSDIDNEEFYASFPLTGKDIIVRFFIYEILTVRRGGPKDSWTGWVESLPPIREINLPFTWDKDEIEDLYGSSIYEAVLSKLEFLKYRYNRLFEAKELREKISEYVKSGPSPQLNLEADLEVTFQDWLLIESWITSRSLEVFEDVGSESLRLGLVPIVDLCNHAEVKWNAKYEFDSESGDVLLIPTKPIKKGEQIFITYGEEKGAGEMLFSYGFIPTGMKVDHAKVATFAIPPLIDEDEEEEGGSKGAAAGASTEEEDDATMVLRAKHRMYGSRARLFRITQLSGKSEAAWESNFVDFLALPAENMSFGDDDKEANQESGAKQQSTTEKPVLRILFQDAEVDLSNINGSLESVLTGETGEAVAHNSSFLAQSLVREIFEEGLNEREKEQKEQGSAMPKRDIHPLIDLEKRLLAQLKF